MHRGILVIILIVISICSTLAQQRSGVNAKTVTSSVTDKGTWFYGNKSEAPRAVKFKPETVTTAHFLANINQYLKVPGEFTFVQAESNTDQLGMQHYFLQQYYKGIALEGMGYRVHSKDGFVASANGKAVNSIQLDTEVVLDEGQAFQQAKKYTKSSDPAVVAGKKLIVSKNFTFSPESFVVAFQFDIDVSLIERWRVSIDARDGSLVNKISLVNTCGDEINPPLPYSTGTGLTNYYGTKTIRVETFGSESSRLVGQTEHGGIIGTYDFANANILGLIFGFYKVYDITSSTTSYTASYYKPGVSVQWAAEQAFEYYYTKHGRNSYDNNGAAITSYVHVDVNMNNAFWTGKVLAFGDGSNNNPLVELDVVGHELTHGVTQHEAQLQYSYEPGALNESFSDILAKAIEFHTLGDAATWQMGRHYLPGGLRDFANPNLKSQPDTYMGDMWFTGYDDNGGVHYNSGVQNFWFYLLCEGGDGVNDHDYSYSVQAIGMQKATDIAYRNLTEYLGYYSDYLDSRIGSQLAAADLYGESSTEYQQVASAWDAVGVIDEPIINSLELFDITATTVKIKGSFSPRADTATYHFEYGPTQDFEHSTEVFGFDGTVEGILTGLESETKYYLRLVATNENGSTYSSTEFTTLSLAPLVKIRQTVDVTETTAKLYGQINPNSLQTSFYFEYGLTPDFGLITPTYPLSDTTEFVDAMATVSGLEARRTYYYRLVATNDFSASESDSAVFFTAVKPVIHSFSPVVAKVEDEIVLVGENFHPDAESNVVHFGATRATVASGSTTALTVKVPAGASFGSITVRDEESGLLAKSAEEFVPTYTGEFTTGSLQLTLASNEGIYQVLVQDMDGDSKPDLVARHYLGFTVFQNVNQGGDVTEESFIRNGFTGTASPGTISLVDFDGNGLSDIVAIWQNELRIYPNFSIPGFVFFGDPITLPSLQNVVCEDFDNDGRVDLAGWTYRGNSAVLVIIRNENYKGTLSAENFRTDYELVVPYNIYFINAGDVDNDGRADLMIGQYDKKQLPILKNVSSVGNFAFETLMVNDEHSSRFVQYTATDLNNDGRKEVISRSPYEVGNLSFFVNKTTGSTMSLDPPIIGLTGYAHPNIQPADITGDGKVDLAMGTDNRQFLLLKNNRADDAPLTSSSFVKFSEYGMPLPNGHAGDSDSKLTVNDLNGDGRPEVIAVMSYSYGPHDGNNFEIWQNSSSSCLEASGVSVTVSLNSATIVLPAGTTFEQFELEYRIKNSSYTWNTATSTSLSLWSGYVYQLRARAKCHLGYTAYYYIDFATDCVNTGSFSVSSITATSAAISAVNLSSFEVQYSVLGANAWNSVAQSATQISNLQPGTKYDVRFRGRCSSTTPYTYKQFTTLCPKLSTLTVSNITYNRAVANWTSTYTGTASVEYSADNSTWKSADNGSMSPLLPAQQYFVRGRFVCSSISSDVINTSFVTPCPEVSELSIEGVTPFGASITWNDESQTGSYTVTYSSTGSGTITTAQTNSRQFELEGLSPGTQYSVAVAPDCALEKDFTSILFTTVCFSPFDLSVNSITETTAELSWNDDFNAVPFYVDYSIVDSDEWLTQQTTSTNISITDLRPGTDYVANVHINCLSVVAPIVSVRFTTALYGETSYAPNPTENIVTIFPSKDLIGEQFQILDNTGRVFVSGKLGGYTFDLSALSPGMYLLRINGEKLMRIIKK